MLTVTPLRTRMLLNDTQQTFYRYLDTVVPILATLAITSWCAGDGGVARVRRGWRRYLRSLRSFHRFGFDGVGIFRREPGTDVLLREKQDRMFSSSLQ
jgi:hypothetical protein